VRVLFLTHRLPFPPNRGDRLRAYHLLRALSREMEVELISLVHDDAEMNEVEALRDELDIQVTPVTVPYYSNRIRALSVLGGSTPLTHVLLNSPDIARAIAESSRRRPDVVFAYCSGMAQFAVRPPLDVVPLVLDLVDLDSSKWLDFANHSGPPLRWVYRREARCLGAFEKHAAATAGVTLVVNDRERDGVLRLCPSANVQVLANGVDVNALAPRSLPAENPRVVFCGVMNYQPNIDGVRWFAREVWPLVRQAFPAATFTIVGSNPTTAIRNLASTSNGIDVTGRVDDVRPHLWGAAVSVAPLLVARGLQNKVLEAVAAGLPTVVTPAVFDGLPHEVHAACRFAATSADFARETIRLLRMSGTARRALAWAAGCQALSWERQMDRLPALVRDTSRGRQLVHSSTAAAS
jgi:sugar transferase (PEP-CTERM/EpsH1 system associated)